MITNENTANPRYQDFVIKDGVLVGDIEGLYKAFDAQLFQSKPDHVRTHEGESLLIGCVE